MARQSSSARKTTVGRRLPDRVAAELRSIYEDSVAYVGRFPMPPTPDEATFRVMLQTLGYDESTIRELGTLSADKTIAALRKVQQSNAGVVGPDRPGQQRVVDAKAVEAWMEKGWRFVSPLNGTQAVIESPGP
jgi:hypothetical protein